MGNCSNCLIGILNFFTLAISILILYGGISLRKQANDDCGRWLDGPIITIGFLLLVVSFFGLIGACCHVSFFLSLYLLFMFIIITFLISFTIFAFAVTQKGPGEMILDTGFNQYKVGDYSDWLQKKVNEPENWNGIRTCLQKGDICSVYKYMTFIDILEKIFRKRIFVVEDGCCKPPEECKFTSENATVWNKPANATYTNSDCDAWSNDPNTLCFNCQSCKAGFLERLKSDLRILAYANILFLVFLVTIFCIACCASIHSRRNRWSRIYH